MDNQKYLHIPIKTLISENPMRADFFVQFHLDYIKENRSFFEVVKNLPQDFWYDHNINEKELIKIFLEFINGLTDAQSTNQIETLEILPGTTKDGSKEDFKLILNPGEINCIVGPTGSGKSRLLADIEWLANADTPTKRKILINGEMADDEVRNNMGGKLIAQITQNMNFVLDMEVYDFLMLHAQSRFLENAEETVNKVIKLANELSGESFAPNTPVTFLSGGQSRALMIADVACIGQAPIVLIDEIENAGVDKKKALDLLISQEKIVLMATHDPLLILLAKKRIVIKNGGIHKIITTSQAEKELYNKLEKIDSTMQKAREYFRNGNNLQGEEKLVIPDLIP